MEITPTSSTIYTVDTHTINCAVKEVLTQTNVEWTTTSTASITLNKNSGTLTAGKTQAATLTLSSADLVALKAGGGSNPEHTYTCKITVGASNTVFTATQTLSIYTPGTGSSSGSMIVYWKLHRVIDFITNLPICYFFANPASGPDQNYSNQPKNPSFQRSQLQQQLLLFTPWTHTQ